MLRFSKKIQTMNKENIVYLGGRELPRYKAKKSPEKT